MPPGDAKAGREVFAAMKCFECHEIRSENFSEAERKPGPELTGMGRHHPAEYFAESIVNPNRVIIKGTGYAGADGLSKMPEYAETMTLRQLIDLVAYLRSLREEETGHGWHHQMRDSPKKGGSTKTK